MSHTAFVLASYGFAALIFAALLGWLLFDRRATIRRLAELEEAGVRRRSGGRASDDG